MIFGIGKRIASAITREVQADYTGNRDFLEAVCAASAFVAASDGDIDDQEKRAAIDNICANKTIGKCYSRNEVEDSFRKMAERVNSRSGRQELLREMDDIANQPTQMREDVYCIALDVADSGGISEAEAARLETISQRLRVDASKFDE